MIVFILISAIFVAILTKYIYDTYGVVDRGLSFGSRLLAFILLASAGVWFLSKAYGASETGQADCSTKRHHRVCDTSKEPYDFATSTLFWFFLGICGISGGVAVLIGPRQDNGS